MFLLRLAKKVRISHFHRERKTLMRKRRKLLNKSIPCKKIERSLIQIEHDICASHLSEKVHDENVAIAKIKSAPNYFFRFARFARFRFARFAKKTVHLKLGH